MEPTTLQLTDEREGVSPSLLVVSDEYPSDTPGSQVLAAAANLAPPDRLGHLWLNFSRIAAYDEAPLPVIVRGEGIYVYDENGREYIDGISSLFTSQLGHGQAKLAEAAFEQMRTLAYFPLWTYAHPKALELADRLAALAPGDLNHVFFTTGGAEANETAWKLARQYFKLTGHPTKTKVISRHLAYHGTAMGALAITGLSSMKDDFEPLVPGALKVPNTNFYRAPVHEDDEYAFGQWAAAKIEEAILEAGPENVALVMIEPVQNAGGCYTPPPGYLAAVREICDRHNVLLAFDEVICGFGRLGWYFAASRYDVTPDIITCAKGLTSAYAPMGAMIASDRIYEPFKSGTTSFLHGYTFSGHPVSSAVALANLDLFEELSVLKNVRANEEYFRHSLEQLYELDIVGHVRGAGYFYAVELVKDRTTKETFNDEESERLLRGFLSGALYDAGLICRADDRGDPVVQLAPPLTTTREQIDEIVARLRRVLTAASAHMAA